MGISSPLPSFLLPIPNTVARGSVGHLVGCVPLLTSLQGILVTVPVCLLLLFLCAQFQPHWPLGYTLNSLLPWGLLFAVPLPLAML